MHDEFYADTVDPFAHNWRTADWGVFHIGSKRPLLTGMTNQQAEDRAAELNSGGTSCAKH